LRLARFLGSREIIAVLISPWNFLMGMEVVIAPSPGRTIAVEAASGLLVTIRPDLSSDSSGSLSDGIHYLSYLFSELGCFSGN